MIQEISPVRQASLRRCKARIRDYNVRYRYQCSAEIEFIDQKTYIPKVSLSKHKSEELDKSE